MLVQRNELENKLEKVITAINGNKLVVDKFCEYMLNLHGVKLGVSTSIVARNLDLTEISKEMLLWVTKELESAVKTDTETAYLAQRIKLENYFTELEIKDIGSKKFVESDKRKYPIVLEKVLQVNDDQWVFVEDVERVKELRDSQIIRYNRKTQRELTLRKSKNGFHFVITIVKSALASIQKLMLDGKFISNAISFNINADEPCDFYYDEEEMTLTINSGKLDIIDGNHRYIAMTNVKDMKPDFEYRTIINLFYFNEDKAKRFIVQEDRRNKISRKQIKKLDVDNYGTIIVNNLNENSSSNLNNMIDTEKGGLIDSALLIDAINYNFSVSGNDKVENNKKLIKIKNFTLKAFNALIDDNINLIEEKQNDLLWLIYVRLMKDYLDTNDIKGFMEQVHKVNKINIDDLNIKVKSVGKSLYSKIDKVLDENK